jgi:alpha-beta hydrolase superfamily lysophospholipase
MSLRDFRFQVGVVPVLKVHGDPRPRPAVVVLHGLRGSAEAQRKELVSLAQAGITAVALDAPHHGQRRDGWLEALDAEGGTRGHARFLRLIIEAVPEVSRVIDHLVTEGHGPIAVLGISMGAYTALAVARAEPRVAATVSILGTPDWKPARSRETDEVRELMRQAPVHAPQELTRAPLLFLNAGKDTSVPPHAAREFASKHAARGVEYVEYPDSDHLMRPEDWAELWQRALDFLRRQPGFSSA